MTARYYKGREVLKEYKQGRLVYEKSTSIPDYLCFTALEAGTFTLTIPAAVTPTYLSYIEWSKDGRTWTHTDNISEAVTIQVDVAQGEKVYWRGDARRWSTNMNTYSNFSSDCRFNVSGNILSLLYDDDFASHSGTTTLAYSFGSLFRNCVNLIDASALILPTGYLGVAALLGLFRDCTSLVHGAPLYAPNIHDSCCYWMYYGCTSMTEMPAIAATSMLKDNGDPCNYGLYYTFYNCSNMEGEVKLNIVGAVGQQVLDGCFSRCSKITSADLAFNGALGKMALRGAFSQCTSLSHVKCLATSFYDDGTAANGSLYNWLNSVSPTGTFIQVSGVTWPRGESGIPTGWVDVEKRTMPSGYKQLLQVTSNGTAYIQLSFGFEETDEVAATFSVDTSQTTDKYIVCPQTWNNNSNRYGMGVHGGGYYTGAFGNLSTGNTILTPRTTNDGELHNWTYAAATFAVTDKSCSINITGATFGGITTNLRLFYGYNSNTKGAISSYKHIKGSTTACDFVAAIRESDDTAGLYDFANDEFVTCNGLTAGEEI